MKRGDEGYEYLGMLEQLANEEGVDMRVVADRVGEVRQRDSEGRKVYTLGTFIIMRTL